MKAELATYLQSIGVQEPFLKRIEEVLAFYEQLFPGQIEDILITEYFDKDGNRQYGRSANSDLVATWRGQLRA